MQLLYLVTKLIYKALFWSNIFSLWILSLSLKKMLQCIFGHFEIM